jgi:hypothetical protein
VGGLVTFLGSTNGEVGVICSIAGSFQIYGCGWCE